MTAHHSRWLKHPINKKWYKDMKKVFVGIDVSKKTLDASVIAPSLTEDKPVIISYGKFDNRPCGYRKIVSMARKAAKAVDDAEILFCCETTGGYDHALCDYMSDKHLDIWREHATRIAKTRPDHGKDDRKDSMLIAEYAWRNRDRAQMYVPSSRSVRDLRQLLLYRRQLVEMRKQLNVRMTDLKATVQSDPTMSFIYSESEKQVKRLTDCIEKCEKMIRETIDSDNEMLKNFGHIMTVKGIGLVSAVAIIAYTGNFKTIDVYKSFACYCGTVPFYEDSGTSIHKREYIGHKSNRMVRSYLIQAAHIATIYNEEMVAYKQRMQSKGKPAGIIVNNVANKLLRLVFSLVANDCDYERGHEFKREERLKKKTMSA